MEPINFPEATKVLEKPHGMTDAECGPLPVFNDGITSISCWKMSWKERLSALFLGKVWLFVLFGNSQPPVALDAKRTIFMKET